MNIIAFWSRPQQTLEREHRLICVDNSQLYLSTVYPLDSPVKSPEKLDHVAWFKENMAVEYG